MNRLLKTSAVTLTLTMALTAGAAIAAPAKITTISNNLQVTSSTAAGAYTVTVNGEALGDTGYQPSGVKEPLLPLRAVAEALGFELKWNNTTKAVDVSRDNIFTTVKSGEDRYAVNKMNTTLGTAPVNKDNKLYVPVSFISEVLRQTVSVEGHQVLISTPAVHANSSGIITVINNTGDYQSVQINGAGTIGTVLNIGEDTVIQAADGTKLTLKDLHIGMTVEVEHANFQTMSLPPQTPAYEITVQDTGVQADMLGTDGTVQEVTKNTDGSLRFFLKGNKLTDGSQSEIILNVDKDTVIVNDKGEALDSTALVQGARVVGFYGPMMTRSLPPIGGAETIIVSSVQDDIPDFTQDSAESSGQDTIQPFVEK
ncbi:copper amine oxidase N-terminal domain-containing protein ['Paenibacillus yunnanensis' Narsing Rao et al. 2020]|uniref:copper amine oxidase N-terminal domain-containing protein n=1 Tax=Paenibacillus tengchongensis TaxID=2608684 RepID=UPI00124ECD63|nr:copper amine oxidase N-terminal domain-containing protein [Paenibacillus tengchongensis]